MYGTNATNEKIKVYSLSDNIPLFSALGKDFSYKDVFVEQPNNYLSPRNLVIGLFVSGKSNNIIRVLEYTSKMDADSCSIVGNYDGKNAKSF